MESHKNSSILWCRFWQNGNVASFRDRRNPEALRFPSYLRIKGLIVCGLTIDLLCAIIVIYGDAADWHLGFDAAIIGLSVILKALIWPPEIVLDQFGLHSCGLVSLFNTHIPWKEVGTVRPSVEVPGFGPKFLGLRNDALEVHSKVGSARVVHTPHHPDRDRLVREVRLRGVAVEESALI